MARQWLVPGHGFIDEDGTEEYLVPGYGFFNENQAVTTGHAGPLVNARRLFSKVGGALVSMVLLLWGK